MISFKFYDLLIVLISKYIHIAGQGFNIWILGVQGKNALQSITAIFVPYQFCGGEKVEVPKCNALVPAKRKMLRIYISFSFIFYSEHLLDLNIREIKTGGIISVEKCFDLFVITKYLPPTCPAPTVLTLQECLQRPGWPHAFSLSLFCLFPCLCFFVLMLILNSPWSTLASFIPKFTQRVEWSACQQHQNLSCTP